MSFQTNKQTIYQVHIEPFLTGNNCKLH